MNIFNNALSAFNVKNNCNLYIYFKDVYPYIKDIHDVETIVKVLDIHFELALQHYYHRMNLLYIGLIVCLTIMIIA